MKALEDYTKRIFLLTGNVRDDIVLTDNRRVPLDRYLFIYLKDYLKYDAVIFLDTRGIYFFDPACRKALSTTGPAGRPAGNKGLEKLKRHPAGIRLNPPPAPGPPVAEQRLRFSYGGNIAEITQFIISHLMARQVHCAVVVYDGSLFYALPPASPVWIQMQGLLRTGIHHLSAARRNLLIWVDGDTPETVSQRFQQLGIDYLFHVPRDAATLTGSAVRMEVPGAGGDEIHRLAALRAVSREHFPDYAAVAREAPVIAGIMRQRQEPLKGFVRRIEAGDHFWENIRQHYGLKTGQPTAEEDLNRLIGMQTLKNEILTLINGIEKKQVVFQDDYALIPQRMRVVQADTWPHIPHLALLGNPGTGKTTVARLIGRLLREKGILESGHLVEITPKDLIAGYVGQTALKTEEQIRRALGGVLFLDEAYELITDDRNSFGSQALTELVKAMDQYQGRFMMIFAGYPHKTRQMLAHNPGCARRVQQIEIQDYSAEELARIMALHLDRQTLPVSPPVRDGASWFGRNLLANRELFGGNHFGNADVVVKQIARAAQMARALEAAALEVAHFDYPHFFTADVPGAEDLEHLIGLDAIKHKLKMMARRMRLEAATAPGHYIFVGNPGTGKTVVARQMAHRFYEMGLLSSAKLNYHTASDLIGRHLGDTESRVKEILNESRGGVLFVDEAHQLASGSRENFYGQAALNTIVPFMENHRDGFCLIFAGYPRPMENLFRYDVGLKGRFTDTIAFPDYADDELVQIFHRMFRLETAYILEGVGDSGLKEAFSHIRRVMGASFSNARMVRSFIGKLKDKAIEDVTSGQTRVVITETHIERVREEWT